MDNELLTAAKALWDQDKKITVFENNSGDLPVYQAALVLNGMFRLIDQIPDRPEPVNTAELQETELRRMLVSRTVSLNQSLTGQPFALPDVINMYGLDQGDLADLRPWLLAHRSAAAQAVEEQFNRTVTDSFELRPSTDVPSIRTRVEDFAAAQIGIYHQALGSLFTNLTAAGTYLHRITADATTHDRSYFNTHTGRLCLSIGAICYEDESGSLHIRERELLRLYGHEGMGHGLKQVVTKGADLPFHLKTSTAATIAAEEAVTQFYEQVIFDDIRQSPVIQHDLHLTSRFEDIYAQREGARLVGDYNNRSLHYGILVLADKSLGEVDDPAVMDRKIDLLSDIALRPSTARDFVESHRHQYDSQGNPSPVLMSELRYSSQAVARSLAIFREEGLVYDHREDRSRIDLAFLTGYYTPLGFVQQASLSARS